MIAKQFRTLMFCAVCAVWGVACSGTQESLPESQPEETTMPESVAVEAPEEEAAPAEAATEEVVPTEASEAEAPEEAVEAEPVSEASPTEAVADGAQVIGDIGPWKIADFSRSGNVRAEGDAIIIERGNDMTGIVYTGEVPRMNYEVRLEAKRVEGSDFFCGLTFPYGETECSFVMGGWGGTVVGLSSIDYYDASENQTGDYFPFESDTWYKVRLEVTELTIKAWIDDEEVVSLETDGHHIGLRWEMDACKPLGVATWQTTGAIRGFMIRELEAEPEL
jgi:hypothetical protein